MKLTPYYTSLAGLVDRLIANIGSIVSLLGLLQLLIVIFALLGMQVRVGYTCCWKINVGASRYSVEGLILKKSEATSTIFGLLISASFKSSLAKTGT